MHQTLPLQEQFICRSSSTSGQESNQALLRSTQDVQGVETHHDVSSSASDHGSFTTRNTGVSYVSSSHWAAVLNSIADLKNHFAQQEEENSPQVSTTLPASFPKPELLYSCPTYETLASIIDCLPPRSTVDRLVSRYFNVLDIPPGIVHSDRFLREYEEFWKDPQKVSILWIGLLYSIMCLSMQHQQILSEASPTSYAIETLATVELYKEKTIQCLILGHYTNGGQYALETLVLYFLIECFHLKDMHIGIGILVGAIVRIAMHKGYHRDAKHFPYISPFAGEMRRRVWALIIQLDSSVASQLGLPRLIREDQCDTTEPRNLHDSDFGEHTVELPTSRPETEVTPTLYVLAKLRLLSVGNKIADVAMTLQKHTYTVILDLDRMIEDAKNALPSSLKWNGLPSSLNVQPTIIIQRIWLEVIVQQLKIVLHRKFLEPIRFHQQYDHSRTICLEAAIKILDLQRLVDEETQPDGLLYQNRWRVSSAFINDFLLATSVLCFYLEAWEKQPTKDVEDSTRKDSESVDTNRITQLLKSSHTVWIRQCSTSKEAQKAVSAIRYVLGESGVDLVQPMREDTSVASFSADTGVSCLPDFTSDTGPPGMLLDHLVEGMAWSTFAANVDSNAEQWFGVGELSQMDWSL